MRAPVVIALALCAAAAAAAPPPEEPPIPSALARLVLAEDSDEITPVLFDHGRHAAVAGCRRCHHDGAATPAGIPGRCRSCHPLHAEEGKPPDL